MTSVSTIAPPGTPTRSEVVGALRQTLRRLETVALENEAPLPFAIPDIDLALGGGLARGALHELSAPREPEIAAVTGFALGLAGLLPGRANLWIAEDMALMESGCAHGPGLDALGLAPERLLTVAAAKPRDVLWAMEEALRCRAVGVVIAELRGGRGDVDLVATRRLSLAAAASGTLGLLLRTAPDAAASAAATRWIVGASASASLHGPGPPRFAVQLVRNRRGPLGSWTLEYSRDQCFVLAAYPEPVAAPARHRPRAAGLG
jgi:protein ImuA